MSPQPWPDQGADALSLTLDAADLFSGIDVSSRPPSCVMANCLQPLLASGGFKAKEIRPPSLPLFFHKALDFSWLLYTQSLHLEKKTSFHVVSF